MEKEELQIILQQKLKEKESLEDLVEFFTDLINLGEIVGRQKIDAEKDILAWKANISYLESQIFLFKAMLNA